MPMGITYDFGAAKAYLAYTRGQRNVYADTNGNDPNSWGNNPSTPLLGSYKQTAYAVGIAIPLEPHLIRAAYVRSKDDSPYFGGWDQKFSLGYNYAFSKRTQLVANFARIQYAAKGRGWTQAVEFGLTHRF